MSDKAPAPKGPKLSRRTVLAVAGASGAGVAAARLLGLRGLGNSTAPSLPQQASTFDWVSPLDKEGARVAQLLRRTSFGASAAELESAQRDGYIKTLDRLLETPAEPPPLAGADDTNQQKAIRLDQLQQWWLDWMATTPTPFAERMTLFWHGHFTSDFRKVGLQFPFIYWQNQTWRRMSLGKLSDMLMSVTIDPAMLRYLDLGNSTGRSPNENYSRELMELFTMGPDAFTEDDVKAAAKALAGWREPRTKAIVDGFKAAEMMRTGKEPANVPPIDDTKTGVFDKNRAYSGPPITFLGKTGAFDTRKTLDAILAQDSVAPHIARKLAVQFVTPGPTEDYVTRLATGFRKSGYDVRSLLRSIFTSPEFTEPAAYRSLIKSPIEYMVSTAKALEAGTQLSKLISGTSPGAGQALFDPPSVGGWPSNESWVSSNTMLMRANFVVAALATLKKIPSAETAHVSQLDSTLSAQTIALLGEATDDRRRWTLLLASPEFQLK